MGAGGASPQPLGPLTQLTVQKGDTVRVTAPGYYPQAVQSPSFFFSLAAFVANLLQQPQPGGPPAPDGRRRALPLLSIGVSAGLPALVRHSGGVPQGYVRLLVFDADSNLVSSQTQQLTQAAATGYEPLRVQVIAPGDGYVTVYVGNESDADVYFDDVEVIHGQGLQVQETHYDPTGLELAGLGGTTPGLKSLSQYRWNSKEFQADLGLNWNHHDWRFLDTQLGRWHSIDQLAQKWNTVSPYSFALNNPLLVADPDGRDNIVYLQAQKSSEQDISRKELRGIARQANANFKQMGLETRVRLSRGDVNYSKLDKTDAVAVIGRGSDVIKTVNAMSKSFGAELKETGFGDKGSPQAERSQSGGNIIAIDSRSMKEAAAAWQETTAATGAFLINHGAGHNAGLKHGGTDQQTRGAGLLTIPLISVMTDGSEISKSVMRDGWGYTPGLGGFISNPSNQHGIIHQSYLMRFGNHPAKATMPISE